MPYAFRVRVTDLGLFDKSLWTKPNPGSGKGQPEAKARRQRFSKRTPGDVWTITLDDVALDLIADEMELDAESLGFAFHRYAEVGHRSKAAGIGGSMLGDIGEVLVWLTNRFVGRDLVRVVGYRAWDPKGQGPFPQPDFLIYDSGVKILEVKSAEAFDFLGLTKGPVGATSAACEPLSAARTAALPQLGFDPASHNPASVSHYLKENAGGIHRVVPFPSTGGVAVAVLARDQRVATMEQLHNAGTRLFPSRDQCAAGPCWNCFSSADGPAHATVVEMPNSPGRLLLSPIEDGLDWFRAYQRWATAVRARDAASVKMTTEILQAATDLWLEKLGPNNDVLASWLRYVWRRYPSDAAYDLGIIVERPQVQAPQAEWQLSVGERQESSVEHVSRGSIAQRLANASDPIRLSVDLRREGLGSLTVRRTDEHLRVEWASPVWWETRAVDDDVADEITARLWTLAAEIVPDWPFPEFRPAPIRRVMASASSSEAQSDRRELLLGWAQEGWFRWPWPVVSLGRPPRGQPGRWGIRLHVTPDGRGVLTLGG